MPEYSVFIEGGFLSGYTNLFEGHGWKVVDKFGKADIIQFTGGSDVDPSLYGHHKSLVTRSNLLRDKRETKIFKVALKNEIPMAGICRGAQFLNVMCGGEMYQDSDGHDLLKGTHNIRDLFSNQEFFATSTHHQLIKPHMSGIVIGVARESKWRLKTIPSSNREIKIFDRNVDDVEIVFYPRQKCFCFQPHPEVNGQSELAERYIFYLEKYLFNDTSRDTQHFDKRKVIK